MAAVLSVSVDFIDGYTGDSNEERGRHLLASGQTFNILLPSPVIALLAFFTQTNSN